MEDSFSESYLSSDFPMTPVTSVEAKSLCIPFKPQRKRRKNSRLWSLKSLSSSSISTGKKKIDKQKAETLSRGREEQQGRRFCSHCGVHKTPQWRMGLLGAKTLCNACGVRFKSSRLLPEYRPACSPTFSVESHSNSPRKVLELRLKKTANQGPI